MAYFIIQFSKFSCGWPQNPPPPRGGTPPSRPLPPARAFCPRIRGFAPNMDLSIFRVDRATFFLKWNPDVTLQVMFRITYARKEIFSWVVRFHTLIDVTINNFEVKVSYLICNTMQRESQIIGGSSRVVIVGILHTHDPLLFLSLIHRSLQPYLATLIGLAWLSRKGFTNAHV